VKLSRRQFANSSRALNWLIGLCLLLILLSALVQAIHIHPVGSADEIKDCPFCQVASATLTAALVLLLLVVLRTAVFTPFAEDSECKPVLCSTSLFSRPPPAA
jgi:hypothetical protein